MLLPDIIIAGAPKCGTTSLFEWLAGHPSICPSTVKETYFLMDKGYPLFRQDNNYHDAGINGYQSFFCHCEQSNQLLLEATPDYLYQKTALDVIPTLPNKPAVVFVLRKPSARVYSLYQFAKNNVSSLDKRVEFQNFVKRLLNGNLVEELQGRPLLQNAIKHSQYVDYIEPWISALDRRVRVFLFEDMVEDPMNFMLNVSGFLGIDGSYFEDYDFSVKNKTFSVKNQAIHRLKRRVADMIPDGPYRQFLSKVYRALNTQRSLPKSTDDLQAIRQLDEYFHEYNCTLGKLLNINLDRWEAQ